MGKPTTNKTMTTLACTMAGFSIGVFCVLITMAVTS
jgi:hypothetical protein